MALSNCMIIVLCLITGIQLILLLCPGWIIYTASDGEETRVLVSILYYIKCNTYTHHCHSVPLVDSEVLSKVEKTTANPAITFWIASTSGIVGLVLILLLLGDVVGGKRFQRISYCDQRGFAILLLCTGTISLVLLSLYANACFKLRFDGYVVEPPVTLVIIGLNALFTYLVAGYLLLVGRYTYIYRRLDGDQMSSTEDPETSVASTSTVVPRRQTQQTSRQQSQRNLPA